MLIGLISLAMIPQDSKHRNFYKQPAAIENETYKAEFLDIVARMSEAKFAIKITNKTDGYLFYRTNESQFVFDFGTSADKPDFTIIDPGKSKTKTIGTSTTGNFHVDQFKFNLDGLYWVSAKGEGVKTEPFTLPATTNEIDNGLFKIKLLDSKQETQETWARFEITYIGNQVGLVSSNLISVKVDGKDLQYANDYKRNEVEILQKGETCKINVSFHIPGKIADMQFSKLLIDWGAAFKESIAKKQNPVSVDFVIDSELTKAKNK